MTTADTIHFLVCVGPGGNSIEGEVYEVDEAMLKALDVLEMVPRVYQREQTQLLNGAVVEVYITTVRPSKGLPDAGTNWKGDEQK